ncbi:phage antirepressor KilAC domain-containing protein [Bacteroides finegoldii]|uniref:Prophage antirepressor n=1 Tax=Bacteroides finegoldii TaxID=338188 RepID=A0A174JKW6_9BACE|nr:phage antirepressor KilAC domain-containing protein [Bacteroides finegoldii]CUO97800.1 Prophage antirepressor [Bacteroides finegoldii]
MEELKLFQSPIFGQVRTVVISGQVMFAATDVAKCLGYANPQKAVRDHCKSAGVNEMDTPTNGGIQKVKFITKGNVVRLVASSELPQAEKVESWIFDEVIPTVLETGGYIATKADDTPEEIMARALLLAQATLAKREERLKQLEAETEQQQATIELQEKEIKQAAPKVNYYDTHLQSVNTLTSTQVAKQIGMVAEKLHKKLNEVGIIFYQSGQWLLYSPYSAWKLHDTRTNTFTRSDGSTGTNSYTVWTEKGRRFIIALYENGWNVKKAIKQIKGELNTAA